MEKNGNISLAISIFLLMSLSMARQTQVLNGDPKNCQKRTRKGKLSIYLSKEEEVLVNGV